MLVDGEGAHTRTGAKANTSTATVCAGANITSAMPQIPQESAAVAPQLPVVIQRALSAVVGACVTSVMVTPLDVVKTRMQAPRTAFSSGHRPTSTVTAMRQLGTAGPHPVWSGCVCGGKCRAARCVWVAYVGARAAATEGLATLWSGLRPSLLMAVPSTALYFSAYDELKVVFEGSSPPGTALHDFAALFAGGTARVVTATFTSPLELVRTKMQASRTNITILESLRWEMRCARSP